MGIARNGYRGLALEEWSLAVARRMPPPGRRAVLTFDDGYRDFIEHAWPVLRDAKFPATVFLVTDHVGARAVWDSRYGDQPTLLSWEEIGHLQRQGVAFGSHTGSHPPLTALSPAEGLCAGTGDPGGAGRPVGQGGDDHRLPLRRPGHRRPADHGAAGQRLAVTCGTVTAASGTTSWLSLVSP
jgi:hypothetical protein